MLYINSANLELFLLRFFDKNATISGETLVMAEKFLFKNGDLPENKIGQPLLGTLKYLQRIMKRNDLRSLPDLENYYDRQRNKAREVFDKLKETDPEECFALHFRQAYTMHMKTLHMVNHNFKSNCLYYLSSHQSYVEFSVIDPQERYQMHAPFQATKQQENQLDKHFMTIVKGNQLALDEKKSCITATRVNDLVSKN